MTEEWRFGDVLEWDNPARTHELSAARLMYVGPQQRPSERFRAVMLTSSKNFEAGEVGDNWSRELWRKVDDAAVR